jgi:hypothetical protein
MVRARQVLCVFAFAGCTGIIGPSDRGGMDGNGDGNLPTSDDPVGATAQKLVIDTPARGAMIAMADGPAVHVTGHIIDHKSNEDLTINGEDVDIGEDGSFAIDVTAELGANVLVADLSGVPGARAARTFLYGEFHSPEEFVRTAAALRINEEGFDDTDDEVDDMSRLVELALAERKLMTKVPATYRIDAPVVGNVDVELTERTAGEPRVDLVPRAGGVTAKITMPNVRIRHRLSFSCAITTCHATGTATADAIIVTVEIDMALEGQAITAATRDATFDLVNFKNDEDGTLASLAQNVVEYFVPDLERRIEDLLRPAVATAARADFALAIGQLSVPTTFDLGPALDAQLDVAQQFDALDFEATGSLVGLGLRVSAPVVEGDPGFGTPGWLKQGGQIGGFRLEPAFGVSSAIDFVNQMMFATWAQGALAYDVAAGTINAGGEIGAIHVSTYAPPVVMPGDEGGALRIVAGDVLLDTTIDGTPLKIVCTIVAYAELSVDAASNKARIELTDDPVIYAEMIEGPDDLPGLFFSSMVEQLGPAAVSDLVGAIPVPLPTLPLDAVAASLAGKQLRIADPAEIVTGEPPARVTLYGRFSAQ